MITALTPATDYRGHALARAVALDRSGWTPFYGGGAAFHRAAIPVSPWCAVTSFSGRRSASTVSAFRRASRGGCTRPHTAEDAFSGTRWPPSCGTGTPFVYRGCGTVSARGQVPLTHSFPRVPATEASPALVFCAIPAAVSGGSADSAGALA